jgi:nuclear transport factor 2 (NTF2) superfamily protein
MQWGIASINDLPIQESDVQSTRSANANIAVAIKVRADLTAQTTTSSKNPSALCFVHKSLLLYHWILGRRPDDHPGLSDLNL